MGDIVDVFRRFFRSIHGVEPFAWQLALAERVLGGGGWPEAIDVPTGLGKTAAIDVAIVSLAQQADWPPAERTAPTRVFVVVDRRLLVDQAYERARRIQAALEGSKDEVVQRVARALQHIGGGGRPLEVVRMRGGVTWSWRWISSPAQPAVVAGTVDQFGSRLLFRGYGVGERLRPIDAALCGMDSLVILDEAHLSPALVLTLEQARELERRAERSVLPRRTPLSVLLSATLRDEEVAGRDVFRLDLGAEASDVAQRRLHARRRLKLAEVSVTRREGPQQLARVLSGLAMGALEAEDPPERIAVVANTVATAREAFLRIREDLADRVDPYLLVGRCRGFERERLGLADSIREVFGSADPRPRRDRPAVLVATQTIEVGADFDVDYLITEAAPLDALLQRFGRLNRLGLRESADAVCVFVPEFHADTPVYGAAIVRTWDWLRGRVSAPPQRLRSTEPSLAGAPVLEIGLDAVSKLVDPTVLAGCAAERPVVPVLVQPYLEAWARTSPSPDPDQPVEPFLHGLDRGMPEVSFAWRASLRSLDAWRIELQALPLLAEELVEVPLWSARRFLRGQGLGSLADLEGLTEPVDEPTASEVRRVVVRRIDGSVEWLSDPASLRPGDTVILDPSAGGHDGWGWTAAPGHVADVADLIPRSRAAIRLRPQVLAWATGEPAGRFLAHLDGGEIPLTEVADTLLGQAIDMARARADGDAAARLWADHADKMRTRLRERTAQVVRPGGDAWTQELGLLVIDRSGTLADHQEDDEEGSTSSASSPVALVQHGQRVGELARLFAERMGLPPDLAKAVEMAGRLHDVGKAEHRFQIMLHRGDPYRFEASGTVLAKSGMDPADRAAFRRARGLAGVPRNWRHEALSAAVVTRYGAIGDEDLDASLVTHLVGAHHGYSRPLFPVPDHDGPVRLVLPAELAHLTGREPASDGIEMAFQLLDWRGPRRFVQLCRRYGWWGLALLESIVRLADMAASEAGS